MSSNSLIRAGMFNHPQVHIESPLDDALTKVLGMVTNPGYRHLPLPVRFRASGALAAWDKVFAAFPDARPVLDALSDPAHPLPEAGQQLAMMLDRHILIPEALARPIAGLGSMSNFLLAFWKRGGSIYEPTQPLGSLLGATDWAKDLPLSYLMPPHHSLCIIPPWQQRQACGGMHAIQIHRHNAQASMGTASGCLTIVAHEVNGLEGMSSLQIQFPITDGQRTLKELLADSAQRTLNRTGPFAMSAAEVAEGTVQWEQIMGYVTKVLLYLRLDDAILKHATPYSDAPKEFPGLGRRKRELKLAEVDQLYDRYIVGPTSLLDIGLGKLPAGFGTSDSHVSPHWRRGHFRLQPHGPQSSLRKVMFIAPTLIRSDRLELVP